MNLLLRIIIQKQLNQTLQFPSKKQFEMIEQSLQKLRVKKSTKGKKKSDSKILEQQQIETQKIVEEGKEISQMSEIDEKEERRRKTQIFYQLTEDLVSYLLLDHEQFKQQIEEALRSLQNLDLALITHKHIVAYSFWGKMEFILQKLLQSPVKFDIKIVEIQKQRLNQNFKQGLRCFDHLKKYYKDQNS